MLLYKTFGPDSTRLDTNTVTHVVATNFVTPSLRIQPSLAVFGPTTTATTLNQLDQHGPCRREFDRHPEGRYPRHLYAEDPEGVAALNTGRCVPEPPILDGV